MKQFVKTFLCIVLLLCGLMDIFWGVMVLFNLTNIASAFGINPQDLSACVSNPAFIMFKSLAGMLLLVVSLYFFLNLYMIIKNSPFALPFTFFQAIFLIIFGVTFYPTFKNNGPGIVIDLIRGILILILALLLKFSTGKENARSITD